MSKVAQKKQIKKERITTAAIELFNQKGYADTKIEDIITRAKVGKGTFYLYFKNKEQLVETVLEDVSSELLSILNWVGEQRLSNADLKDIFRKEGELLAELLSQNKEMAIFINKHARGVSVKIDSMIQEFIDALVDICTAHFEDAIKNGEFASNLNPQITAMSVIGGISFIYYQWSSGQMKMAVEQTVESMLNFYLNALGLH